MRSIGGIMNIGGGVLMTVIGVVLLVLGILGIGERLTFIIVGAAFIPGGLFMAWMGKWLMGLFKGIPEPPSLGQSLKSASASMNAASQMLAAQTQAQSLGISGLDATAQVMAVRDTGTLINYDPVVEMDLLVTRGEAPPYPVMNHRQIVSKILIGRLIPGASFKAKVDPANPNVLQISWV